MSPKKTILFVDDDFRDRRYLDNIKFFFERDYNLITFFSGQEALDEMNNGLKYDLGITDLRLHDIDGHEIINLSKELHSHVPFFIYSIYPFWYPLADRTIEKPQRPSYLVEVINKFFNKR